MTQVAEHRLREKNTMRKRGHSSPIGIILAAGAFLILVLAAASCSGNSINTGTAGDTVNGSGGSGPNAGKITPPPTQKPGSGYSGPSTTKVGIPGIQPTSPGKFPAFSADDVTNFVQTHDFPGAVSASKNPQITHNELLDLGVIAPMIDDPTVLSFNFTKPQLWYVELHGDFVFPGPSSNPNLDFKVAYELIDPATGNIVGEGGLTQPTAPPTQGPTPTSPSTQPTQPSAPTATATPRPVVNFKVRPTTFKQTCGNVGPLSITLDNTGSNVAVSWKAGIIDLVPNTATLWATASPTSGTVAAGGTATLTLTPSSSICQNITQPTPFHAEVDLTGATGTFPIVDTISPAPIQ
jgi:hypothetical protein